ncbi:MAG: hypothetical protein KAR06_02860 [Deltaproteobacteria bacterium]|nr:hypothetical protein [Deltaproteobacteria bacterium]
MPILNYTTTISAQKTVGEIMGILVGHGAKSVLMDYDDDKHIKSLSFKISTPHGEIGIRLPVNPDAVLRVLEEQKVPGRYLNKTHAIKVAWRIVKTWVSAQMAILETEMVRMEQIFLPYILDDSGKTLYHVMVERNFLIGMGDKK